MVVLMTWAAKTEAVVLPEPPLPRKVTNLVGFWQDSSLEDVATTTTTTTATEAARCFLENDVRTRDERISRPGLEHDVREEASKDTIFGVNSRYLKSGSCGGFWAGWLVIKEIWHSDTQLTLEFDPDRTLSHFPTTLFILLIMFHNLS